MAEVYPVVHINDETTACRQAELALGLGADGVFLIDHVRLQDTERVFNVFNQIGGEGVWVGVNLLGFAASAATNALKEARRSGMLHRAPDALWVDDAVSDRSFPGVKNILAASNGLRRTQYFGGIAFKYTPHHTENPEAAAYQASRYAHNVDVVTTSGPATGREASVDKLRAMRDVTWQPLAVASGVTPENVGNYTSIVDKILVASSVETGRYSGIFVEARLRAMIDGAHDLGN